MRPIRDGLTRSYIPGLLNDSAGLSQCSNNLPVMLLFHFNRALRGAQKVPYHGKFTEGQTFPMLIPLRSAEQLTWLTVCPRCSGCITSEHVSDGNLWLYVLKCINCGYYHFGNKKDDDSVSLPCQWSPGFQELVHVKLKREEATETNQNTNTRHSRLTSDKRGNDA